MKISGMEKFSLVDYKDKVACTVFTPGCNFRCPFCHNSGLVLGGSAEIISENEVFSYLEKRKGLVDAVCVSGGEPTLQKDLPVFLEKVKSLGLFAKLDTNGSHHDVVKNLVESGLVDYVAMDVKNSKQHYAATIGLDLYGTSQIEETADYLMSCGVDYEFRTTLVNGFHTEEDIEKIGKWLEGAKAFFLQRFVDRDSCIAEGLSEIPYQKAEKMLEILKRYVPDSSLRGY